MFDYEKPPSGAMPTDYTGLVIVAMLAPVFFLFVFLGRADMGLAACIVLGMAMVAIRLRWKLREHMWFWATIAIVLLPHIPLVLIARWPQGNVPVIAYSMPLGIADFAIIWGVIGLAERVFSKSSSTEEE